MSVQISIVPQWSKPNIYRLKLWSELTDPLDRSLFSSTRGQPTGQTLGQQALYTPYLLSNGVWAGSWGANQNSPSISNADFLRIASLQTADSFTIDDKMKYISCGGQGVWGQAIMATYTPSSNWQAAVNIKMNQVVYAGNYVEVLDEKQMTIDTFGTVSMVKIATGWNQLHVYTAVTADNTHYWEAKGKIVLPLLPKADYEWWILKRWLV